MPLQQVMSGKLVYMQKYPNQPSFYCHTQKTNQDELKTFLSEVNPKGTKRKT